MADIKSTLDLVMEKTRHLQMSAKELGEQRQTEARAKIRGLIAKLADQVLDEERFASAYRDLRQQYALADDGALVAECLAQLSIAGDNEAALYPLRGIAGVDVTAIRTVVEQFQHCRRQITAEASERLTAALAADHGISGSAVVPNIEGDDEWKRAVGALDDEFRSEMAQLAVRLSRPK